MWIKKLNNTDKYLTRKNETLSTQQNSTSSVHMNTCTLPRSTLWQEPQQDRPLYSLPQTKNSWRGDCQLTPQLCQNRRKCYPSIAISHTKCCSIFKLKDMFEFVSKSLIDNICIIFTLFLPC